MVSDLAVVLPDEFFAELNLLPFLIGLEIPETVFVRGAKRVDEHEAPFLVHRELLLAIHVNKSSLPHFRIQTIVDLQDGFDEVVVLSRAELRDRERLRRRELTIHFLELRRHLDERLRERFAVPRSMACGEPRVRRSNLARLDSVMKRSGDVIARDDLERDQEVLRLRGDRVVVRNDLDPSHPHAVPVEDAQEVGADSEAFNELEPVRRGPAEGFPFVRDEGGDHLVEHADLVREDELEFGLGDLVNLFDLASPEESHEPTVARRRAGPLRDLGGGGTRFGLRPPERVRGRSTSRGGATPDRSTR